MRVGIPHVGGQDAAAIWCLPGESDATDLERNAAPDGGILKPELLIELRHLRRVAEGIGKISDSHRAAVRLGRGNPALQVTEQRLAADQEFIRECVPRSDLDLAAPNCAFEP